MLASGKASNSAGGAVRSILGFHHPDGSPVTLADCERQHAQALEANRQRAAQRAHWLDLLPDPEAVAAVCELDREARMGHHVAAAWCALVGVFREAGQP